MINHLTGGPPATFKGDKAKKLIRDEITAPFVRQRKQQQQHALWGVAELAYLSN